LLQNIARVIFRSLQQWNMGLSEEREQDREEASLLAVDTIDCFVIGWL